MKKTVHNMIKNKMLITAKEAAHFHEVGVPVVTRVSDGAQFVNKKLVSQHRQRKFYKMLANNSERKFSLSL